MSLSKMVSMAEPVVVVKPPEPIEPRAQGYPGSIGTASFAISPNLPRVPVLLRPSTAISAPAREATPAQPVKVPGMEAVKESLSSALQTISTYIPSEILAGYLAVLGLVAPSTKAQRWWLFGGAMFVLAAFIVLKYLLAARDYRTAQAKTDEIAAQTGGGVATVSFDAHRYVSAFLISAVAFIAYAMSIPSNPFESWLGTHSTQIAGGAAIALAILLPMVADLVDFPNLDQQAVRENERAEATGSGIGGSSGDGGSHAASPGEDDTSILSQFGQANPPEPGEPGGRR